MDIWKHGTYIDLWSFVHLLSGALLAIGFYGLGSGLALALIFSCTILIAWEVFEWAIRIVESRTNVIIDLLVGALGLLGGVYWHYVLANPFDLLVFSIALTGTLVLALWGFIDFHFRGYR